ncbi:MAG: oxidoreductase, partial [Isosphaeraceae bacterium]
ETPVRAGNPTSGIFSLAILGTREGLAIGGDYQAPDRAGQTLARTVDGGSTWTVVENAPRGYRSATVSSPGEAGRMVAVGPGGGDYSVNSGRDWSPISDQGFHALSAQTDVWAVGDEGKVGRLVWEPARRD